MKKSVEDRIEEIDKKISEKEKFIKKMEGEIENLKKEKWKIFISSCEQKNISISDLVSKMNDLNPVSVGEKEKKSNEENLVKTEKESAEELKIGKEKTDEKNNLFGKSPWD